MRSPHVLVSPSSLKGVLTAAEAAAALAEGFSNAGVAAQELPVGDGGEGTMDVLVTALGGALSPPHHVHDAFGRPREARVGELEDGTTIVEAAQVIPLDPTRLDPMSASSRGLGELIAALDCDRLLVCLGGTANVDGGTGLRQALGELPCATTVLCDVRAPLVDAARVFAPQKGASPEQIHVLEARLLAIEELAPYAELPGAGAAGGLGAAFAALGAELGPGAEYVLERIGFRERARAAALVVTGEGVVDATTAAGKAPAAVARACAEEGVRCVVFGGRVEAALPGVEHAELSGDPARAREDLVALGARLGSELAF